MDEQMWSLLLVSHALQVTLLIGVVWWVTKTLVKNRPHLAHLLWILVLLKCLMPPTWSSPTGIFSWLNASFAKTYLSQTTTEPKVQEAIRNHPNEVQPDLIRFSVSYGQAGGNVDPERSEDSVLPPKHIASLGANRNVSAWIWSLRVCVIAISVGFVVGLASTAIRLTRFLKSAYAGGFRSDIAIDAKVRQLCKRFGIKRRVSVRLILNPIGPVVVGLIRPTLLLPDVIVTGKSPEELEPLLAHELIHIRRGDLWWALIQTLATSLWWFHPLVHIASRMATREAERSCDEETVLSLGCSPSLYARCLLEVLERKHQLQIAPALPGVRPVDITLKRMERIMKLGHGGHRRAPHWVWGLFFIACTLALPSAALSVVQDESTAKVIPPPTTPIPPVQSRIEGVLKDVRWEVGDLLDKLEKQGYSDDEAKKQLLSKLPSRKSASGMVKSDLGLEGQVVIEIPEPTIDDRQLLVFELQSQIEAIGASLAQLRKSWQKQLACEIEIVSLAPDDYITLSKEWPDLQVVTTSQADAEKQSPKLWDQIEVGQATMLEKALEKQSVAKSENSNDLRKGDSVVQVPRARRIVQINGSRSVNPKMVTVVADERKQLLANLRVQCMFYQKLAALDGQPTGVGLEYATEHLFMRLTTQETKVNFESVITADYSVQLSLELAITELGLQEDEFIQAFPTHSVQIAVKEKLQTGKTLIVGGLNTKTIDGEDRVCLMFFSPIGVEIGQQVEFEPLLVRKDPKDFHTLQIMGPLTKASNQTTLLPPSDDEVIHGIELKRTELKAGPLSRTALTVRLRKISERAEPVKFVPLIGFASRRHSIYECTILRDTAPGVFETIFIDHNYFQMAE